MKKLVLLLGGITIGFILAHLVNQTASGRSLFEKINSCVDAFNKRLSDSYHDEFDHQA